MLPVLATVTQKNNAYSMSTGRFTRRIDSPFLVYRIEARLATYGTYRTVNGTRGEYGTVLYRGQYNRSSCRTGTVLRYYEMVRWSTGKLRF